MNKAYKKIYLIVVILNLILLVFNSISFAGENSYIQIQLADTYLIDYSDHNNHANSIDLSNVDNGNNDDNRQENNQSDWQALPISETATTPVVEFMGELIEKAHVQVKMNPAFDVCEDCEFSLSDQVENSCNEQNNYLKQHLKLLLVKTKKHLPSVRAVFLRFRKRKRFDLASIPNI